MTAQEDRDLLWDTMSKWEEVPITFPLWDDSIKDDRTIGIILYPNGTWRFIP